MRKSLCILTCLMISLISYGQKNIGSIVGLDPVFDQLIDRNTPIQVLSEGFMWAEGPVWVRKFNCLLFSDVPANCIYKWSSEAGVTLFLSPSGFTGLMPYSRESGSNGLIINDNGELVTCEHGDRRISVMPLAHGGKRTLTDNYNGNTFNSPNDIVQKSNGDYYFSDPIFGLPEDSAATKMRGLYRLSQSGKVNLLIDSLTPNGLTFSPDEKFLYVSQSLTDKPYIFSYEVGEDGTLHNGKLFFDGTSLVKAGFPGLPDGMKADMYGNLFACGPGGVLVISSQGKLLGRIDTGKATANCNWGDDGSTLYITAHTLLCRVTTKTKGAVFP